MSSDHQRVPPYNKQVSTTFRWPIHGRRKRVPSIRLGNKKPRRGLFLARLCRKAKLKWLSVKYLCMLKKLKKYYDTFVNDMFQNTVDSCQGRMLMETTFAVPVMGLGFDFYPSTTYAPKLKTSTIVN